MAKQTNRTGFGTELADARKVARLTSHQLARRAGLDGDLVVHWERGQREPNRQAVQKLTRVLKGRTGRPFASA